MLPATLKKTVLRTSLILVALSLLLVAVKAYRYQRRAQENIREAKHQAELGATHATEEITARLRKVMAPVDALVRDLEAGKVERAALPARLKETLGGAQAFEMGVAFAPYARDPAVKLDAPHAFTPDGHIDNFQLEERYDYTQYDWYKDAMSKGAGWGEPYFGKAVGALVVGYAAPFRLPGSKTEGPSGVVRMNLSMAGIHEIVSSLSIGRTGYGFLLSRKGVYLSDPVSQYVRDQKTIFDIARERNDPTRRELGERALRGERAQVEGTSGLTGQKTWVFAAPVAVAGWSLGAVFLEEEVALHPRERRRGLLGLAFTVMLALATLSLVLFRVDQANTQALWRYTIALSLIFLGGVVFTWDLTLRIVDRGVENATRILDQASLQKFVAEEGRMSTAFRGNIAAVTIPTGFFLETLRFASANDVIITAHVWQKYTTEQLATVGQGVVLPDAESFELKETYRRQEEGYVTIGYALKATVRQSFENSLKYPFDIASIRVSLWPKDFDKNVLLVPDIASYDLMSSSALPGVDDALVIPGWKPLGSFFSYALRKYNTNFGVSEFVGRGRSQKLCFNVTLQRKFLDPFLSTLLPIFVVAGLLFSLLLACTKIKEKVAATGFKATDILRAAATLLFPAIIAQINLRSKIAASGIIYMEYFYFVLYTVIMLVAANALQFAVADRGWTQFRDNLIPKILYLPVLSAAFFAVTVAFLY